MSQGPARPIANNRNSQDHQQVKVFHVGLSGSDQIDLHPHLQIVAYAKKHFKIAALRAAAAAGH
jgi:hypothetical protein